MKTLEYLSDPVLRGLYWPGIVAGLAMAVLCASLSVFVVLKKLAFIGQGISHAAFGGIGVAAVLGLTATTTAAAPWLGVPQFVCVTGFCLAAALAVGLMSDGPRDERATQADTAIGIVLVGSMAVGSILLRLTSAGLAWDSFLFGNLLSVATVDAVTAWVVTLGVVAALWWYRRGIVFWTFDETSARAFGVRTSAVRLVLLVMLALATVTAMKLAGVVLATALLVLPGATALRLSARLPVVIALSVVVGLVSVVLGIVGAFEFDVPPGSAIVCVLVGAFAAAWAATRVAR